MGVVKPRTLRSQLLLLVSVAAEVYGAVSYSNVYRRLRWPGYGEKSTRTMLGRMIARRELQVVRDKLTVGSKGEALLSDWLPVRRFRQKQWDGRWRLIIYDIPEERRRQRQLLRKTLLHYGYGLWQKSVYLTPHPVMEVVTAWLRKHNLLSTVVCLESTKVGGLRDSELAREVFCNKQRLDMWRALEDSTFSIEKGKGKLWMRRLEELLIHDPWLPRELEDPYIFKVREKLVKRVANTFS